MPRGRLNSEDESIIRRNYPYLKGELEAKDVVDYLFQAEVLSNDDKEKIYNQNFSKSDRNEILLTAVLNGGERAFAAFCRSLEESYSHVLQRLQRRALTNSEATENDTEKLKGEIIILKRKNDELKEEIITLKSKYQDVDEILKLKNKALESQFNALGRSILLFQVAIDEALENVLMPFKITGVEKVWQEFLVFSSFCDLEKTVKVLLKKGINPNLLASLSQNLLGSSTSMLDQNSYIKKYQENMTPLMAACLNRSFKTLTLLLEAQADVNAKDGYQDTSLIYLCREKYVVNAQEDEDKNNQTLKIPKFCLDQLISKGADINVKGRDGMTALMHCARNGNSTFIQVLEANNVNMKLQCNEGRTALIYATQYQSEECVSCIYYLINNSDVNARDAEGDTALMHSIKYKNERVFMFLVKKSDINIQNNQRMTALMLAVQTEEKKYVAELLNHGPLLNLQNKDGDTALILATRNGEENKKDIFKLLCEAKGIELNTQNKQGETALIVAARNLNKTFVEDLISKGAHRFMTDKDRKSALDHATQSKSELKGDTEIGEQIMEMLKKKKINK